MNACRKNKNTEVWPNDIIKPSRASFRLVNRVIISLSKYFYKHKFPLNVDLVLH